MIIGIEIDFIVSDSLKVLVLYKEIFEVYVVEVIKYFVGRNEVVFNLYDIWFYMLDVNEEFGLKVLDLEYFNIIWFNIMVVDIV